MRSQLVEFGAEEVEAALLGGEVPGWGQGRFGLECSVHAFMSAVLPSFAGSNKFW